MAAVEEAQMKVRVPKDRRETFKAIAAMQGKSMTELVNEMMEEEIRDFDFEEYQHV